MTSRSAAHFYLHLAATDHLPKTNTWINRLSLLTLNFACGAHVDRFDKKPRLAQNIVNDLDDVVSDDEDDEENAVPDIVKKAAARSTYFIKDTDNAIPTTCCYQLVKLDKTYDYSKLQDYHFFVNDGMASCIRLTDKLTNTFCASVYQHNTAVPIFWEKTEEDSWVYHLGEHPKAVMVAWGGGNNNGENEAAQVDITGTVRRQGRNLPIFGTSSGRSRCVLGQRMDSASA